MLDVLTLKMAIENERCVRQMLLTFVHTCLHNGIEKNTNDKYVSLYVNNIHVKIRKY